MRKSRISSGKQSRLIEHFVADTTAQRAAGLVRVNKTTTAYYYHINVKPFDIAYAKKIMVGHFWLHNSQVVPASENTV